MRTEHPDCLIVLDTMGIRTDAAILGITALRFDLDSDIVKERTLEIAVDLTSNCTAGRSYDSHTLQWWADQHDMAAIFGREGMPLPDALDELSEFYQGSVHLWVMGHGFENAILANAYEHHHSPAPWNYWDVMDGRTFINVATWLDGEQEMLTGRGISSLITARSRAAVLRGCYNSLHARKEFAAYADTKHASGD